MKKLFVAIALAAIIFTAALPLLFSACAKPVDYGSCISEMRSEIYLYRDDSLSVTINCVRREQPYNADGICGEMCDLVEIFVSFEKNPETAEITLGGYSGELNFEAVKNVYTVTYAGEPFSSDGVDCTLTFDESELTFCALPAADGATISCEQALKFAQENSPESFSSLTSKGQFCGEIFVRLIYDDGCYYCVGVCDREKNVKAWLLDGVSGKIVSSKNYSIFSNAMRSV